MPTCLMCLNVCLPIKIRILMSSCLMFGKCNRGWSDAYNTVTDLVNHTQLYLGIRKDSLYGFREAFKPINASDENILYATIV